MDSDLGEGIGFVCTARELGMKTNLQSIIILGADRSKFSFSLVLARRTSDFLESKSSISLALLPHKLTSDT